MAGRPRKYTKKFADNICARISEGESLRSICREDGMPSLATVMMWRATDENGFLEQYEKACISRAFIWSEELLDITDNSSNDWMERNDPDNPGYQLNGESVSRSRLRVDTRKWLLSKVLPKYADNTPIVSNSEELASVVGKLIDKLPG